jgi:hypothetical protein
MDMEKTEFHRVVTLIREATDYTDLRVIGDAVTRKDFIAGLREFDSKLAEPVQKTVNAREELIAYVRVRCARL